MMKTMKRGNYEALDHLATMVAVTSREGRCVYVNAAFETALGLPRRSLLGGRVADWMVDPSTLEATLQSVVRNEFSTGRFEALLHRPQGSGLERLPVHVIVTQVDHGELVLIELVEVEQQSRQDREARTWSRRASPRNSSATWRTRSRTRWAASAARRSCWRWSCPAAA